MIAMNEVFRWANGSLYLDGWVFFALYFPMAYFLLVRARKDD